MASRAAMSCMYAAAAASTPAKRSTVLLTSSGPLAVSKFTSRPNSIVAALWYAAPAVSRWRSGMSTLKFAVTS